MSPTRLIKEFNKTLRAKFWDETMKVYGDEVQGFDDRTQVSNTEE